MKLNIGKHMNHIALMQFSETSLTRPEFVFDRFYDAKKIGGAIEMMKYHAGKKTMTGYSLGLAKDEVR